MMTFRELVAMREGYLLPAVHRPKAFEDQPFPTTDGLRRRLHIKPPKKPKPFAPTVQAVKEVVPNKPISKLKQQPTW
jgi:hypothetical protein